MAKGWFKIPGIRPEGDRSVEEQMLGLQPALAEAKGKTVLDLGCAEGPISRAFALAGAIDVLGVELLEEHLKVARRLCADVPQVRFVCAHLDGYVAEVNPPGTVPPLFDIVLALGIIHKLDDPAVPLRFAARSARDLLCYRASAHARDGIIVSKFKKIACNVPAVMTQEGFVEERLIPGVRGEAVQYWRRK